MVHLYMHKNVFDAALERINFVFDNCDDIIVAFSGGKDSTVVFNLTKMVARERGRLPIKVVWLDQEAEWQATEDYVRSVMYDPEVDPYWFQIPFRLTNSLSFQNNFLYCWREEDRAKWIREQDPISIKVNPLPHFDRFHDILDNLYSTCNVENKLHVGVIAGMRADESPTRRLAITGGNPAAFKGITWCRAPVQNTRIFWPIYDFATKDVWAAIAKNDWPYNRVYDHFYKLGMPPQKMRVSALIHETAWHSIEALQEVEPQMFNRYIARVEGVSTFSHFEKQIMPDALPPYFSDWREYRDYLLENLIEAKHHALFRKRWERLSGKQTTEDWYKIHVREIMVNDIDGTLWDNARVRFAQTAGDSAEGNAITMKRKKRVAAAIRQNEGA